MPYEGVCDRCGESVMVSLVRKPPGQKSKIGEERVKVQVVLSQETLDRIAKDFPGPRAVGVREALEERYGQK